MRVKQLCSSRLLNEIDVDCNRAKMRVLIKKIMIIQFSEMFIDDVISWLVFCLPIRNSVLNLAAQQLKRNF